MQYLTTFCTDFSGGCRQSLRVISGVAQCFSLIKTRVSETVLPVDAETYRDYRTCTENEERLFIASEEGTGKFVISDKGEEDVAKSFRRGGVLHTVVGLDIVVILLALVSNAIM